MKKLFIIFFFILLVYTIIITNPMIEKINYQKFESYSEINSPDTKTSDNYDIFIDGTRHKLYLFNNSKLVKEYNIASGKLETPSPIGIWKIKHKAFWGEGFGGYWLGLNVPWGTYGIHGTTRPSSIGKNASHGCIRMYSKDAKELFNTISLNTAVYIYMGPYGAFTDDFRVLKPGDCGSDVLAIQMVLRKKGYYDGSLDGIYGISMEKSIYKFQYDNKLPVKVIIDADTYKMLGLFPFE